MFSPKTLSSRWSSLTDPLAWRGSKAGGWYRRDTPLPAAAVPITAIFALSGGSGKTCLLATLGRILSKSGESVVLAETDPRSQLPLYFAAEDLRSGVRTLPSAALPAMTLVRFDIEAAARDPEREAQAVRSLLDRGGGASRLMVDVSDRGGWFLRRLSGPLLTVLIPVPPTMSCVIGLQAVERFFRDFSDSGSHPVLPNYLINQFDEGQPIHREVRDFLRRSVGDRLLPVVIRSSSAVRHALDRGMTVVDYAPHALVSDDYRAAARWLVAHTPKAPEPVSVSPIRRWGRP